MPLPPLVKAPPLLEADVSQQVCDFMRAKGWRGVRHQRTVVPGQFQSGEPGIADWQWIFYLGKLKRGLTVTLWTEIKGPRDKRTCNCKWRLASKKRGKCGVCLQADWHARERSRTAEVWSVSDIQEHMLRYEATFGWLHKGEVPGQIELELT